MQAPRDSFGPLNGNLRHEIDEYIEEYSPEFTATDDEYVIEATFVNPFGASEHRWSYGFIFGKTGEEADWNARLVVHSGGWWSIGVSTSGIPTTWLHGGSVPQLLNRIGEKNRVTVYVDGRYGWLYVNGLKVLDLEGYEVPFYGLGIDLGRGAGRIARGFRGRGHRVH